MVKFVRESGAKRPLVEAERQKSEASLKKQKSSSCRICDIGRELRIAKTDKVTLSIHPFSRTPYQLMIAPIEHVAVCSLLDDESCLDIRDFKKALVQMLSKIESSSSFLKVMKDYKYHKEPSRSSYLPIFVEFYGGSGGGTWKEQVMKGAKGMGSHSTIDVFIVSEEDFENARMYFMHEFRNRLAHESRHYKSLITENPSPKLGSKKMLPKGLTLPFIYVDFALEEAYLHVIEDKKLLNNSKAIRELIMGIYKGGREKEEILQPPKIDTQYISMIKENFTKYDFTKYMIESEN